MMIQSCTYLPPELWFNILTRLPVKTLLRFKLVCKGWCEIISSRSFINAHMEKKELLLSGFFIQEKFTSSNDDLKLINYIKIPRFDDHHDSNTSSKSIIDHGILSFIPEQVVVMASCNGLICCRSCFAQNSYNPERTLYVCNRTNKEYIRLSSVDYKRCESIALAFDPSEDFKDKSTKFSLVKVKPIHILNVEDENEEDNRYFEFWIYSSETRLWVRSKELCHCENNRIKKEGIYCGGVLHWLTYGSEILTFNVGNERSWLISAPLPSNEFRTKTVACIGECKGILHYIMVSEQGLHVWYLDEVKWEVKFWKSLEEIKGQLEEIKGQYPQFFFNLTEDNVSPWMYPLAFKDGVLLIKVCRNLYFYDIEKNKMIQAYKLQPLDAKNLPDPVVPYCMSLVPLN